MNDDDDETWRKRQQRALTDSERQAFAAQWSSGVPSVGDADRDDTSPIDLFERAPRGATTDIVAKLKRNPEKLIPFLGEFAQWVVEKMRERSSSEQSALAELRELLNKPPNGAVKRLEAHVAGLENAVRELVDRIEEVERVASRVAVVEDTISSVKGHGWKAALAVVTALLGSAAAIIATLQAKAERDGIMTERVLTIQRDIAELKASRIGTDRRRDYDYDITPRPFQPPKKDQ